MSLQRVKELIADRKIICPECQKPVKQFDRYVELHGFSDGAGDSQGEDLGSELTLVCANVPCDWQERSQFWENYVDE